MLQFVHIKSSSLLLCTKFYESSWRRRGSRMSTCTSRRARHIRSRLFDSAFSHIQMQGLLIFFLRFKDNSLSIPLVVLCFTEASRTIQPSHRLTKGKCDLLFWGFCIQEKSSWNKRSKLFFAHFMLRVPEKVCNYEITNEDSGLWLILLL